MRTNSCSSSISGVILRGLRDVAPVAARSCSPSTCAPPDDAAGDRGDDEDRRWPRRSARCDAGVFLRRFVRVDGLVMRAICGAAASAATSSRTAAAIEIFAPPAASVIAVAHLHAMPARRARRYPGSRCSSRRRATGWPSMRDAPVLVRRHAHDQKALRRSSPRRCVAVLAVSRSVHDAARGNERGRGRRRRRGVAVAAVGELAARSRGGRRWSRI